MVKIYDFHKIAFLSEVIIKIVKRFMQLRELFRHKRLNYFLVSRQVKKPQMPLRNQMNDREEEENQNKFMLVGKVGTRFWL